MRHRPGIHEGYLRVGDDLAVEAACSCGWATSFGPEARYLEVMETITGHFREIAREHVPHGVYAVDERRT